MMHPQHECPFCDTVVPAGTEECPGCHAELTLCGNPGCGQLYPRKAPCCSFCGWQVPATATTPPPVDPVVSSGPEGLGLEEPATEVASAALATPTSFDELLLLFQQDARAPAVSDGSGAAGPVVGVPPTGPATIPLPLAMAAHAFGSPSSGSLTPAQADPASGFLTCGPVAMFPDMLGAIAAGGGVAPIVLEVESSQKYRRGQQGVLRLRARAERLDADAVVEVGVSCGVAASPMVGHARLGPMETCELGAMRFIPRVAGSDHVSATITLKTVASFPIGRWTGSWVIHIEDVEKERPSINSAGGDVFIMGGAVTSPKMPGLDAPLSMGIESWQVVPLQSDLAFNRRLSNICPRSELLPPLLDPGPGWPAGARAQGAVHIRDQYTGLVQTVAVVCCRSVSLGRGGDPAVAWWLQPSPYDAHQHGRLSRRHISLELRDGRAWVTDWSTNGVWLNGERLSKSQPHLLAHDDRLELARVIPFHSSLLAAENGVYAVWLRREDTLGDRLCYLTTDGQVPVALTIPGQTAPALWLAWRRTLELGPELLVCSAEGGPWSAIGESQERLFVGRFSVRWVLMPNPVEQTAYLDNADSP